MDAIIVDRTVIAEALGYDEKYINELVNSQGLPKVAYNQYNLVDVVRWYRVYRDGVEERRVTEARKDKPQDDLARESAMAKKISNMERLGYLIPAGEIERVLREEKALFVRGVENLPARIFIRIKKFLTGNTGEVLTLIEDECNELRSRISQVRETDAADVAAAVDGIGGDTL